MFLQSYMFLLTILLCIAKQFQPCMNITADLFRSCYQKHVIKHCACADPRYGKPDNAEWCRIDSVNCTMILKSKENVEGAEEKIDVLQDCGCYPPCEETTYRTILSQSYSPALYYKIPSYCTNAANLKTQKWAKDGSCDPFPELCINNTVDCVNWYRENSVNVDVFFQELAYHRYVEKEKFTNFDLILGLGGQLGLWLGVSVITMIEFVGLGILVCMFCFSRGKTEQSAPEDQEAEDLQKIQKLLGERAVRKATEQEERRMELEELSKEDEFNVEDPYPELDHSDLYDDVDISDPYPEIAY